MKRFIFYILLFGFVLSQDVLSGYLKSTEVSFCMDECGLYHIENEFDAGFGITPVVFSDEIDLEMYLNRFVEVRVGAEEINCIECSALEVLEISLSNECDYPVPCFADPCDVAEECQLNTPVDCIPNYCGGCYADFYDLNNSLVYCYDEDEEDVECSDIDNPYECYAVGCNWEQSNNIPGDGFCFEDEDGEENPCSDFGQEDCEWFDECVWTDSGCQDAILEDDCNALTQDECESVDYCDWLASDSPNSWGMCVDAEDGPPECALDCEGIENIDLDEHGMYFCEWLLAVVPSGCMEDCGQELLDDVEEFMHICDECLPIGNCDDYFNDDENIECSEFTNEEECRMNECDWQLNPAGIGQCIDASDFQPVCEDLSDYFFGMCDMIIGIGWNGEECTWYSGCDTIDENGIDHSQSLFDSVEECESVCMGNQQDNGVLYGYVEYIWGDAIELVSGAIIEIQGVNSNFLYTTLTNDQGSYEIELPQGPYVVTVRAYEELQTQDIYITANEDNELNFTFGEFYYETILTGFVYTNVASGLIPIQNAHITITNPNNWLIIDVYTNEDGFFFINLPSSGMYNINITADGYMDFSDYVYVAGGMTEINFTLDIYNGGGDGYAVLDLEDVVVSPGSEIAIPLLLESDLPVAGVQFSVYLSGEGFPEYLYPAGLASMNDCFTANFNELNGAFIGIIFSLEGCTYPEGENVHIADLIYEVSNDAPSGLELLLEFESTLVSDSEGNEILSYGDGASVSFGAIGDVNSDGQIDVLDIVLIVSFAIYVEEPTNAQFWASDVNGDSMINVLDIVQVINLILDN